LDKSCNFQMSCPTVMFRTKPLLKLLRYAAFRRPVRLRLPLPRVLGLSCLALPVALATRTSTRSLPPTISLKPGRLKVVVELVWLVWDCVCAVWRAVRTLAAVLPCLLLLPLALLPPPLPRLAPRRLAGLVLACAEAAGPVYVKLAQWAATRRDLLPGEVCEVLAGLQDRTSPHPWAATLRLLRQDFGADFADFHSRLWLEDTLPVASGCCAQVYHGWVDGEEVAIKVVHPQLERQLQLDLMVLAAAARWVTWLVPRLAWLNLGGTVAEFGELMTRQMDMVEEAANLQRFRHNFRHREDVVFPEPLMHHCRRRVLVESWVAGTSISSLLAPGAEGEECRAMAARGADMLLQMVFHDNLWHGDLHPGNLLVTPAGGLAVLDPGITCSFSREDRANLVDTFRAVVVGDGGRVGELFLERSEHRCREPAAFVLEMQGIVAAARRQQLCLETVDVSLLLQQVFGALMRHQVRLDASFLSVVIAVTVVEVNEAIRGINTLTLAQGLARSLDRNLDLVARALPFVMSIPTSEPS